MDYIWDLEVGIIRPLLITIKYGWIDSEDRISYVRVYVELWAVVDR